MLLFPAPCSERHRGHGKDAAAEAGDIVVAHVVAGQQQRVSHAEPEREVVDQTVLRRRLDVHAAELDVVRLLEGGAALSCPLLLQLLEHLDLPAATVGAQRSGRFEPRASTLLTICMIRCAVPVFCEITWKT